MLLLDYILHSLRFICINYVIDELVFTYIRTYSCFSIDTGSIAPYHIQETNKHRGFETFHNSNRV